MDGKEVPGSTQVESLSTTFRLRFVDERDEGVKRKIPQSDIEQ